MVLSVGQLLINPLDRFLFRLAHALADFILYRAFGAVELPDALAQTAHEFRYFVAPKQQEHDEEDHGQFAAAQVAKKKKCVCHILDV